MTTSDSTESTKPSAPRVQKMKVGDLYPLRFKGWALRVGDGAHATNPTREDAQRFVENGGGPSQALVFDSPDFRAEFTRYSQSVGHDLAKVLQWAMDYHAARVAYFMVNGWDGWPIRLAANCDMVDGQHRLLAAVFLNREEVDVQIDNVAPQESRD